MERGLASIAVLVLFAVLAALLGVWLPIIKSDAPLKVSDWLGFAGNIISAVLAAIAVTVAWVAAQRQIRHAARQNSVIAYGALREVIASINRDAIINLSICTALARIEEELKDMRKKKEINSRLMSLSYSFVGRELNSLKEAKDELEERRENPWGGPKERAVRDNLIRFTETYSVLTKARMGIFEQTVGEMVETEEAASTVEAGILEEESLAAAIEASQRFREVADTEMNRTYALMDRHFESVTLST
jgi:hypothetical protein